MILIIPGGELARDKNEILHRNLTYDSLAKNIAKDWPGDPLPVSLNHD